MPPFVGQGFSSGARDVSNLAWKLDAILAGAPERLIDSYEAERRPHVTATQALAVRWGGVVQTTAPRRARLRDRIMDTLDDTAPLRVLRELAKPLPTYGAGAFAERPARLPPLRAVGALFPQPLVGVPTVRLDDALPAGWAALSCDPAATRALAAGGVAVLEVGRDLPDAEHVLRAWLVARHAGWVLLRPDRFVFACGPTSAVPATLAALRATVGETAATPVTKRN
jgi:3-(3-hydroxy-phenyl)propionate hydroxylase